MASTRTLKRSDIAGVPPLIAEHPDVTEYYLALPPEKQANFQSRSAQRELIAKRAACRGRVYATPPVEELYGFVGER